MTKSKPWYVVIQRMTHDFEPLPDYVFGPYEKEAQAIEEMDSDDPFGAMIIDAKSENYIAEDCYRTQALPEDMVLCGITIEDEKV